MDMETYLNWEGLWPEATSQGTQYVSIVQSDKLQKTCLGPSMKPQAVDFRHLVVRSGVYGDPLPLSPCTVLDTHLYVISLILCS